jgi:hypothetical protein
VRIVARHAGERFALTKTAAGHETDRCKSYGHGILELGFVARAGLRDAMAFSTDLRLRRRAQTPRIQQLAPYSDWRKTGFCGCDVRTARSMAALALYSGLHGV